MKSFYDFKFNKIPKMGLVLAITAVMAGCASNPGPIAQMAASRAEISNASRAGAGEFAPQQFKSSMDKMSGAERAMNDKNYDLARQLSEQAQIDAQLATSATRSAKAQKSADTIQEDNRVLRQEINRNTK